MTSYYQVSHIFATWLFYKWKYTATWTVVFILVCFCNAIDKPYSVRTKQSIHVVNTGLLDRYIKWLCTKCNLLNGKSGITVNYYNNFLMCINVITKICAYSLIYNCISMCTPFRHFVNWNCF